MHTNKLITLLQTFSSHELVRFRKYLLSPFFNENEELVRLYEAVRPILSSNNKTEGKDDKLGVWAKMFPRKDFNDTRFRRLCSDLLRLAMDFLAYNNYVRHPGSTHRYLLDAMTGTPLKKHFNGAIRQMEKTLMAAGNRDADYHYLSYFMNRKLQEQQEHDPNKAALFDHLKKASYHLDCYYLSKKLEQYTDSLGYQDMLSEAEDIQLFPGLLEHVKNSHYLNEPAVKAWYLIVLMRLYPEQEDYFFQLKNLIENEGHCFPQKELHTFFIHLMNYCIYTKINQNRPDYYEELFYLYLISIEKEIIFINQQLNPHHYKNIITISLRLEKFEWVENFIQNYTHLLPESDKENAYNYNLANVYFSQGKYEKVIEQLREVEYQNITYALGSKLLLLRTYFELKEDTALSSLIDSFRIYLRRNREITTSVKQQYMNTLRFTKKIASIAPYDERSKDKIIEKINNSNALVLKNWLLEKVSGI
ncbi:MAG: hypothetical protein AAFZ15_15805 [Bacteroidota bacterium]